MNKALLALVLCAAGAGGYALATFGQRTKPHASRAGQPMPARELEPRAVEPAAVIPSRVITEPAPIANAEPARAPEPEPSDSTLEGTTAPRERETASERERGAYAERAFAADSSDSASAPATARRLGSAATASGMSGVRVNSVQCRSTLCKVEVALDDANAVGKYIVSFTQSAQWDGTAMFVRDERDPRGGQAMTIYLARDDTPLPEPPPSSVAQN